MQWGGEGGGGRVQRARVTYDVRQRVWHVQDNVENKLIVVQPLHALLLPAVACAAVDADGASEHKQQPPYASFPAACGRAQLQLYPVPVPSRGA
jgi:hypothetical protein